MMKRRCWLKSLMIIDDKGVVFIGVNSKDPDKLAHEYLAEYGITYANGLDIGDRIQRAYNTAGYPETFIIDRNGEITKHFCRAAI